MSSHKTIFWLVGKVLHILFLDHDDKCSIHTKCHYIDNIGKGFLDAEGARVLLGWVLRDNTFFQSYKNIYLTGFNQCTIAQIRIKLTIDEMT